MFREMRRKGQSLPPEEIDQILEEADYITVAFHGDGGYPYAVPLCFVRCGDTIYFHSAKQGHKVDALRSDEKVSFVAIGEQRIVNEEYTTYYRSVMGFGRARIVDDPDEKLTSARALGDRCWPDHDAELDAELARGLDRMLMVAIDIEHLTGKESIEFAQMRRGARKA